MGIKNLLKRIWCVLNGGHVFSNHRDLDGLKCIMCPYKSPGFRHIDKPERLRVVKW